MHLGLFHTRAGWKHAGGKAVFVRSMARALAADHDVTLYTQLDPDSDVVQRLRAAGVDVVGLDTPDAPRVERAIERYLPVGPDPLMGLTWAVADGIASHITRTVDVLVTHRYLEDLVLSQLVDVPVVYQYHGVQQVGTGANLRELCSDASLHVANSHAVAAEVRTKLGRSVDGIVSPGVDTETFSPAADPLDLGPGPTLLFVGRVVPRKGVLDLLDALAAMDHDPTLVVVGDGDTETVRTRAQARGVADRVQFAGEQPHEALAGYYTAADVFCNPTHYEGFGMVNVEAMACGTPVVTTRVDGASEYARDGENCLLVPPSDTTALAQALDGLLADPDRRERLGRAGRETATEYDWHRQATRLVELCRRATGE